ncbi:MAG: Maltodextrin ABC transporter, permease protein MdxG [uncultured Thermomicrobiales bacterium]|uniref:Maltodextrin ABC transporter, permease protein MdxG n=1 Tax=uncultured Thermomicrobiales bacterium TaxID=1645740 RepID=A0A6J4VHL4_9BACT|nr:MAG: Maltodextrin ABC transporter, permease protein MdxG [uncultured Thermomicrobiales bacterium]
MGVAIPAPALRRTPSVPYRGHRFLRRAGFWIGLLVLLSPAVFVFLWMLSLSLKPDVENTAYPPIFIPRNPTLDNFREIFENSPFGRYAVNSLVVAVASTALSLALGVPAGYGIAKTKANGLAVFVLVSRMTPGLSYLIPWFILFRYLGLNNTLWALIITHLVIGLPITIWVMMGFFEDLHPELEEAALVDGAGIWAAFRDVALPLSRPGMVVAAILAFIFSWNNFIFAVVLAGQETRTLPVAVFNVLTFEQLAWGALAAAALVVTLPVLLLTVFVQRQIVVGMTAGGMKG